MTHKKFLLWRLLGVRCIFAAAVPGILWLGLCVVPEGLRLTVFVVAGAVFLVLLILFGGVFCGFICPLGLIFDLLWRAAEARKSLRTRDFPRMRTITPGLSWKF